MCVCVEAIRRRRKGREVNNGPKDPLLKVMSKRGRRERGKKTQQRRRRCTVNFFIVFLDRTTSYTIRVCIFVLLEHKIILYSVILRSRYVKSKKFTGSQGKFRGIF